ncbi:MAG TPA: V-type ATP synthase subunit K [Rectinema sp.]|jgi:V/A-type H+-transporting ATPase subunit K|nr:V-type ATP synthase subunit K [Spirochaetia bacterium]HAL94281.1 V-type ATP synthase subunit K [Spirochaetaceae bacterium]HNV18037.1 V-type ATP synthase subunit K [Rectinema sp.]HNY98440.1 V-type ATP synthase subunit K [Rectinema sp.]HOD57771.1 V-type ATP synthase subunit K [Rectinema sp.]
MNIALIGAACVLGFGAIGSGIGAGIAGMAAIGSWKRSYLNNKAPSFLLVAFAGAPLTQTIYSFILMTRIINSTKEPLLLLAAGIMSGLSEGISAIAQGQAAAAGCDAFGETGKGFANYIIVVGLVETVALFTLAFTFSVI